MTEVNFASPTEFVESDGRLTLSCNNQNCRHSCTYGAGFEDHDKARGAFSRHTDQHAEGHTPDVWMTTTYSGYCSSCGRRFEYEPDGDDERVWCNHCSASWDIYGTDGRTDITYPE